jgi:hypothetical protein
MQNSRSQSTSGGSNPTPPIHNKVRAIAKARFEANPETCFQGIIRQVWAEVDPRPPLKFDGTERVEEIGREEAADLIVRYEWLGTVGRGIESFYGLKMHGELLGACAFGRMGGQVGNICGPELAEQTVCLHRGCCTHFAPDLAASFLINHACRQARRDHDWRVFFGYSDAAAGERGAFSITHHNLQRGSLGQIRQDDSLSVYGWLGTPNSRNVRARSGVSFARPLRVKAVCDCH